MFEVQLVEGLTLWINALAVQAVREGVRAGTCEIIIDSETSHWVEADLKKTVHRIHKTLRAIHTPSG